MLSLFERDIREDVPMMTSLKDKGIPIQTIPPRHEKTIRHGRNTVLVAKAGFHNGVKSKVVVYFDVALDRSELSAQWSRLRGYHKLHITTSVCSKLPIISFIDSQVNYSMCLLDH